MARGSDLLRGPCLYIWVKLEAHLSSQWAPGKGITSVSLWANLPLNIPGKFAQVRTAGSDPAVVVGCASGGDLHLGTGAFRLLHCSLLSTMENLSVLCNLCFPHHQKHLASVLQLLAQLLPLPLHPPKESLRLAVGP